MTKILGISGSPVVGSSVEILVKEILKGAESLGADVEYIYINELDITACQACGQTPDDGFCFFNDSMDEIYKKFEWCDAIVVGSPIYFDSVSAQTKLFIDRTNCFRSMPSGGTETFELRYKKKRRGAIVLVGGERGKFEPARKAIAGFYIWAEIESKGTITFSQSGFEKGSVKEDNSVMKEAFELGKKLCI